MLTVLKDSYGLETLCIRFNSFTGQDSANYCFNCFVFKLCLWHIRYC